MSEQLRADRALGAALAELAAEAGAFILPLWRSGLAVERKADESPVTAADQGAETLILNGLARLFPGVPVISEEDASAFGTPDQIGPRFFLVDPLDGTKAFVRGDPAFTVNIALVQDGIPVAAALGAPASDELWWTTSDGVAKRSGSAGETTVTARSRPADGGVALGSHTLKPEQEGWLRTEYGFATMQRMDSSLKLARIAEGAADLYARYGPTMEWDIAAGHALLLAAGGAITTPEGGPFRYGKADQGFRNGHFVARGG